jgi:hypothetical protein
MILFLDFDGVLHPEHDREPTPADQVFCHLPRFETIMRDFPTVEIVISSMWRHQFSLEYLRSRFSPDIAGRITGTTSTQPMVDLREREILDWLAAHGRSDDLWIALDDAVWQFKQYRQRLVACTWYVGLDDEVETRLRAALAS